MRTWINEADEAALGAIESELGHIRRLLELILREIQGGGR